MNNNQISFPELIDRLIKSHTEGCKGLAKRFKVSESTIIQWASGSSTPYPAIEEEIRLLTTQLQVNESQGIYQLNLFDLPSNNKEDHIRSVIGQTLQKIRELLHKSGRLSTRHEALDELAKLFFAHIMSITGNGDGISKSIIRNGQPATSLKYFVSNEYHLHLPVSLSHELKPNDFQLRIKDSENQFAIDLIDCFSRLASPDIANQIRNCSGIDILNDAFGQFLSDSFADEKELGQYLTPTEIVKFMVRLGLKTLDPKDLDDFYHPHKCSSLGFIFDPACGVGSFLVETLRVLQERVRNLYEINALSEWVNYMLNSAIIGIDKSERMVKLALANLALFGAPVANLHLANSLLKYGPDANITQSLEGKAKLILTNPPFGAEFSISDLRKYRLGSKLFNRSIKSVPSELLFMERCIDWLAPGGVLLAIVPDSVLTNRGIFEDLRNGIINSIQLLSVISLPSVTFGAAGTNTKTSIIHLKKIEHTSLSKWSVYFSISKNVGFEVLTRDSQRRKISNGESDLSIILKEATGESLPQFGQSIILDPKDSRWDAIYHASLPSEIQKRLETANDNLKVKDIAFLVNERINPEQLGKEYFEYIEIGDIDSKSCSVSSKSILCLNAPSRARKIVRAGDVLFSTVRPERRAIGVVPIKLDGAICSTGFAVLRCKNINPFVFAKLLQSDFSNLQILRNNIGIAYPTVDESCVLKIVLPISFSCLDEIQSIAEDLEIARLKLELCESRFDKSLYKITKDWMEL